MKRYLTLALVSLAMLFAGCTRIETGEVGLRLNASKQIEGSELLEGSWNQTMIGSVLTFPVRDIALPLTDLRPVAEEGSPIGDLDFTVIYNINTASVSDLWSKKSRSFHTYTADGDWLLMNNYMRTIANNAAQKVISSKPMLKLQAQRELIESELLNTIHEQLKKDHYDSAVLVSSVRVQALKPNQTILDAATKTIEAEQKLATATANTELAKQEALRQQALAANSDKTIAYMDAESRKLIAEAIHNGKVQTIILPMDFKGLVNTGK